MVQRFISWRLVFFAFMPLLLLAACERRSQSVTDHPRLTLNVAMQDVQFFSTALGRSMTYRVILPAHVPSGAKLPVVYLLHGGDGGFRDWSNQSDVARFAEAGLILVMPEADDSYYTNARMQPNDRYEDYIVNDLVADVEKRFPCAAQRERRAAIGVSMGGYGAVKIGLKHPELFAFVGGLSPAVDVPSRPFSWKRISQWRHHRSIFGEWGAATRRDNDPYVLVMKSDSSKAPYMFLSCGDQEGLLPANQKFAKLLDQRGFAHEFHVVPGGHNWMQWNQQLEKCFRSLNARTQRVE